MAKVNIDQIDIATARITQVGGILDLLTESEIFNGVGGEMGMSAIWAAQALLEQAGTAVNAITTAPATA